MTERRRVFTLDPATLVITGGEGELGDVETFVRSGLRMQTTGGVLRALLVSETAAWGVLVLSRDVPFTARDCERVAARVPELAEELRRAVREPHAGDDGPLGLALLADDDTVAVSDGAARHWIAELGGGVPLVVAAVASRARRDPALARARVRTRNGTWLVVRGSALADAIAVTLEPAHPHDLAPLIADACVLTERERAVTQLIASGLPTGAIAGRLHLSPWTVQDHLKSIFDKVGVGTRGELVARVFFEQSVPRLS